MTSVSVRSASHGNNAPGGPLQRLPGVVASEWVHKKAMSKAVQGQSLKMCFAEFFKDVR